jgi:tetratricopeptide (TPR) repeat protein
MALIAGVLAGAALALGVQADEYDPEGRYDAALEAGFRLAEERRHEAAAQAYGEAFALLEAASGGAHPDLIDIAARQAESLALAGRAQAVLDRVDPILARPGFETAAPETQVWLLASRAEALSLMARAPEAAETYQSAVWTAEAAGLSPDWIDPLRLDRALALSRSGRALDGASELEALVLDMDRRGARDTLLADEAAVGLAVLLAQAGDDRAEGLAAQLLDREPALHPLDRASLHNALGEIRRRTGRLEEARAAFLRALAELEALEAAPGGDGPAAERTFERAVLFSNLALLADAAGDPDAARRHAQRSVALEENHAALALLAHLAADEGRMDEGFALLDRADAVNAATVNDDEGAARQMGWRADFHARSERWEDALSASRRASRLFDQGRRAGRSWAASERTRRFFLLHVESAWRVSQPD